MQASARTRSGAPKIARTLDAGWLWQRELDEQRRHGRAGHHPRQAASRAARRASTAGRNARSAGWTSRRTQAASRSASIRTTSASERPAIVRQRLTPSRGCRCGRPRSPRDPTRAPGLGAEPQPERRVGHGASAACQRRATASSGIRAVGISSCRSSTFASRRSTSRATPFVAASSSCARTQTNEAGLLLQLGRLYPDS